MGRLFLSRESRLKSRVVPKLGSGSTPVPLKPKFGTRRGVNGRILKLVVLGSASCSFFKKFGEVDPTECGPVPQCPSLEKLSQVAGPRTPNNNNGKLCIRILFLMQLSTTVSSYTYKEADAEIDGRTEGAMPMTCITRR